MLLTAVLAASINHFPDTLGTSQYTVIINRIRSSILVCAVLLEHVERVQIRSGHKCLLECLSSASMVKSSVRHPIASSGVKRPRTVYPVVTDDERTTKRAPNPMAEVHHAVTTRGVTGGHTSIPPHLNLCGWHAHDQGSANYDTIFYAQSLSI